MGCSGLVKGLLGTAVALIAAGSSIVAILDYFQVKPIPPNQASLGIINTVTQETLPVLQPVEQAILSTNTVQPTITTQPTPLPKPDAIEFVLSYWQNVSDRSFETAWSQLSPGFRQALHNNNYEDYVQGYQKMNLCRIEVSNANLIQQDDFMAVVSAHFIYYKGAQCSASQHNFEMRLIYDQDSNSWLFDKNIVRP